MKKFILLLTLAAAIHLCAGESYSFHLISDLHLGPADTYHPTRFKGNRQRADLSTPALKNMLSRICKNTPDTKFVIQLGDLIEGNTKGTAEHRKQIRSAFNLLKESCPCPVYHTMGNHEPFGLGAAEALKAELLPEIAKTINKKQINFVNYSFFHGDDLFIFSDYRRPAKGSQFITDTLKALKKKPRYVFIACHIPVTFLTRTELADTLAQYNAVVMSGHIHWNTLLHYTKNGKTMTQITVTTQLPAKNPAKQRIRISTTEKKVFRDFIEKQAKKHKKKNYMDYYTKEWEPYITSFTTYRGSGVTTVHVSDSGIILERQGSDPAGKPIATTILKNKEK